MNGVITRLTHEPYECKICDTKFSGPNNFAQHRDSKKHRRAVEKHRLCASSPSPDTGHTPQQILPPGNFVRCTTCNVDISGAENLIQHNEGKRHKKAVAMLEQSAVGGSVETASTVAVTLTSVSPREKGSVASVAAVANSLRSLHLGERVGRESDEVCDELRSSGSESCSSRVSTMLCPAFGTVEYASEPEDSTADSVAGKTAVLLKNEPRHSSLPPPKGEIRAPESISTESGGRVTYIDSTSSVPKVRVEGCAEGYACFKCGILLFRDRDAALDHYGTDSHMAKWQAASEANRQKE